MNILLLCSMGMSTGMLCDKIKNAADADHCEINIWAASEINAREHVEKADLILLGPQIRYMQKRISDLVEHKKPIAIIDMVAYGTMNGEKVYEDIKKIMGGIK